MAKLFLPTKLTDATVVPWEKVAPKSVFKLEKDSRAGVVLDKGGAPRIFIFDTNALLDVLSEIDEKLIDKLSDKEYASKSANPAGWLIDEIESKLPLRNDFIESLRKAIKEAQEKGWIPFSKILNKF
ncbi:hypothetical protein KKA09_02450 [Patescibacteria group bacterium]|nr:hypothetical protein [Patescibacteria group bacterium]